MWTTLKYRLHPACSNNQAEAIAILKSLEQLQTLTDYSNKGTKVALHTDSKVTLASLKNNSIHSPIIEEIRNKIRQLMEKSWNIDFGWVKAHVGIEGNEEADYLAKEAALDGELRIEYNKVPTTTLVSELKKTTQDKWQRPHKKDPKQIIFSKH